jgi:hypothetical protein
VLAQLASRLALIAVATSLAGAAGCAAPSGEDDVEEGAKQALVERRVEGLAAVSPPLHLVTSRTAAAMLGTPLPAGRKLVVIRELTLDGADARLVVDATSLRTALVSSNELSRATRGANAADAFDETPYVASLRELASTHRALERIDDEAATGSVREPFALTVDMCQSRKPWERRLFEWAVDLSTTTGKPVPIGVAMTGGWAKAYPNELDQLLGWERAGKLAITWINHSATHPLHCEDASCRRAKFLTDPSVDFDAEVLGLERALISRGLLPSPIFRFPGLTHDSTRLGQLARLSLMAIDADAWIAKGQPIRSRSVVLVHGNGNEPQGIDGFLRAVREPTRAAELRGGQSALVSPLLIAPSPPR